MTSLSYQVSASQMVQPFIHQYDAQTKIFIQVGNAQSESNQNDGCQKPHEREENEHWMDMGT